MSTSARITVFIWGLIALVQPAPAATIQCPQSINTKQSLQSTVQGWDSFLDDWNESYPFDGVTFYDLHPKEHASLAPDNDDSKSSKLIWTFGKNQIWMACRYSNTSIQLIKKLPKGTKKCDVTYEDSSLHKISVNCD